MSRLNLTLRQRKLLHYMQNLKNPSSYVTGKELAQHLGVSDRTIRNDIETINEILSVRNIAILARKRYGYYLWAYAPSSLKELTLSSESFLTREDRVRYILFQLCLSADPLSLYDLEDEMFVSHTTLEHDLSVLCQQYDLSLLRSRSTIFLQSEERKIRILLNRLFTDNWDYNASGNAYYQYQYLQKEVVDIITAETSRFVHEHGLIMDDINMVTLNISIAIMYYRIGSGHTLQDFPAHTPADKTMICICDKLLDSLERQLDCSFPVSERADIYLHIACSVRLDPHALHFDTVARYFDSSLLALADTYLARIREVFQIDLSTDEDFYITLLQYLRDLALPVHYFNEIGTPASTVRSNLLVSYELACLIGPLARDYYGSYLNYRELTYLAFCISGALEHKNTTAPKLRTLILCHLNLTCTWNLKYKILAKFEDAIDLKNLLPVYVKDYHDFTDIDLVITTTTKELQPQGDSKTIIISPFFTMEDENRIEAYIAGKRLAQLYTGSLPSLARLLDTAYWHESLGCDSYEQALSLLASDLTASGNVPASYLKDILLRESILSFVFCPSIAVIYSYIPAQCTQLSIGTFAHRLRVHGQKLRTIVMISIQPGDASFVLALLQHLYLGSLDSGQAAHLTTRSELTEYLMQTDL